MTDSQVWALWLAVLSLGMSGGWAACAVAGSLLFLLVDWRERRRLMADDPDERRR